MPTVIPSNEYPDASQVDTTDPDARLQYFFDVARYFGSLDYQVFQVTKESCIQRVCSDLSRMDMYFVVDARFHYILESAIWTKFFCHLGEEAPEFPWTLDQFPRRKRNLPDIYREWLIANDLVVMYRGPHSISRSEDGN